MSKCAVLRGPSDDSCPMETGECSSESTPDIEQLTIGPIATDPPPSKKMRVVATPETLDVGPAKRKNGVRYDLPIAHNLALDFVPDVDAIQKPSIGKKRPYVGANSHITNR